VLAAAHRSAAEKRAVRIDHAMFDQFGACEICDIRDWRAVYEGTVRDGAFGNHRDGALVAACTGCGAHRLDERHCLAEEDYESDAYRDRLGQGTDLAAHFVAHDHLQLHALNVIRPHSLRDCVIADVGAGGGSFLDHVHGLVGRAIAIEPARHFRTALAARGYGTHAYAADAASALGPVVDVAVSLHVIEHVRDPRAFLADIRGLMKPGGRVVISTPNRADILLDLLPDVFPEFFYRVVHRWYFDAASMARCAELAGFKVEEVRYLHRYGMANALHWLRDRRPKGDTPIAGIDTMADGFWTSYLEASGRSDTLFMTLKPKNKQD
jgi:2-polyprenyl-3-methyl-5-hydroxy-6-metoxy-1,4-benzoquinol methylase